MPRNPAFFRPIHYKHDRFPAAGQLENPPAFLTRSRRRLRVPHPSRQRRLGNRAGVPNSGALPSRGWGTNLASMLWEASRSGRRGLALGHWPKAKWDCLGDVDWSRRHLIGGTIVCMPLFAGLCLGVPPVQVPMLGVPLPLRGWGTISPRRPGQPRAHQTKQHQTLTNHPSITIPP